MFLLPPPTILLITDIGPSFLPILPSTVRCLCCTTIRSSCQPYHDTRFGRILACLWDTECQPATNGRCTSLRQDVGPRLREDDRTGAQRSHPRLVSPAQVGIHPCVIVWVPASAGTGEPGLLRKTPSRVDARWHRPPPGPAGYAVPCPQDRHRRNGTPAHHQQSTLRPSR